ncbi:GroES-like protein [Aspergillus sclerotioniger CBS 115572]|uniref:GroES-like protein n=1 Tax=Aspergillus sclerotioniger CBS 115572 TaxID=1450535 RepID=A0A317X5P4_9EURO|nr:GroES-like protein [Aspergillus sclerotioniger CBS 115572]PWY93893.1 GroES-like protein [Aspergillus sclerotioniger CBS 115572]
MTTIPTRQTAACIDTPGPGAQLVLRDDIPVPSPTAGEVLIQLEFTGFCHSDLHNINGDLHMTTNVPGHEGVGRVVRVGPDVEDNMLGRRVGVKWLQKSCMKCPTCKVQYTNCLRQDNSGRNVPGTFQQYFVSPADFVSLIPEDLDPAGVAPLLCAGLTMYGALSKLDKFCEKGDWVVIMGAGGGLGHLGIQIGKEMGYRMIGVDSAAKKDICLNSGATAFFDFKDENLITHIQNTTENIGAHAVLVVVGSETAYEQSVQLLRPLGTLICVGFPRPGFHIPMTPQFCVDRGLRVLGSVVGTETEMQALLQLAREGKVSTHYEVFDLVDINLVAERMRGYAVEGRAVLRIPSGIL